MSEYLFIKVFDRRVFKEGVAGDTAVKEKVFLPINPYSVTFRTGRIFDELQTVKPQRYILVDWGVEMTGIAVSAQTGRILPLSDVFKGIKRFEDLSYEDFVSYPLKPTALNLPLDVPMEERVRGVLDKVRKIGDDSAGYIVELSKFRYLLVKALEYVYKSFDANQQIMCMDWMKRRYFGIISDFSYEITVDSLWNIKFNFTFKCFPRLSMLDKLLDEFNRVVIKGG